MQITSAQKRRVAVFFIGGVVFFVLIVMLLVGNKLLKREDCYYSRFKEISVAGLTEGSSVKFQGMNIGVISNINIDNEDTSIVEIGYCIKPGVAVREGTSAVLGSIGITGLKFLELKGGGTGIKIPVNGEIPSEKSQWDEISGKATVITAKIESILNRVNLMLEKTDPETISKISKNVEEVTTSIDMILKDNRGNVKRLVANTDKTMLSLNKRLDEISKLSNNLEKITAPQGPVENVLVSAKEMSAQVKNTLEEAKIAETTNKIYDLLTSIQKMTETINLTLMRSQENIDVSLDELSDSMQNFNEFTRKIMENPSAIINGGKGDKK